MTLSPQNADIYDTTPMMTALQNYDFAYPLLFKVSD